MFIHKVVLTSGTYKTQAVNVSVSVRRRDLHP